MTRPNEPPMAEPLAYFLTWSTYGTWLPGDDRGWVKYHRGFQAPNPTVEFEAFVRMTAYDRRLDKRQRKLVESTIADHCRFRSWSLHVVNCRTNHVHVVVSANLHPAEVRRQFNAWCTRRLNELEAECSVPPGNIRLSRSHRWWANRGSARYINDERSLEAAIQYVRDAQDRPR